MSRDVRSLLAVSAMAAVLSGCGSAYSGLSNTSGLGAGQYQPAVYVPAKNQATYGQVLAVCRQVAANRQATAAQKAQLETLTGAVEGASQGVAAGLELGSLLDNAGFDTSAGEGALVGAAAGVIGGLASSFAKGAERTADETRRILLNCLEATSNGRTLWKVLE